MAKTLIDPMLYSTLINGEFVANTNILNPAFGLVAKGTAPQIMDGGNFFTWRFRNSLTGDMSVITESTNLESGAAQINEYSQKGVVLRRGKSWKETGVDIAITGSNDAAQILGLQLSQFMNAKYLTSVSKAVRGAFNAAGFSDFVVDNIAEGDLDYNMIIDIKADKFPSRPDWAKILVVHPKVAAQLRKQGVKDFANADNLVQQYLTTNTLPNINGVALIENAIMCESYTSGVDTIYPSYLMAPGSLLLDFQKNLAVETEYKSMIGGGTNFYTAYAYYMTSLYGATWAVTTTDPTDTNLTTGTNWDCVVPTTEEARAIQILTKINS